MWVQLSTTCSNVLKQPNGELLVAVNPNQLRTMALETVDPIDWSHPPPSWTVPPERHVHSINQCNLRGTRTCNRSMRGNHLTQGVRSGKENARRTAPELWRHKMAAAASCDVTYKKRFISSPDTVVLLPSISSIYQS